MQKTSNFLKKHTFLLLSTKNVSLIFINNVSYLEEKALFSCKTIIATGQVFC